MERLHPRPADGNPSVAFVGAGAIGGYVGAHLFRTGFDVTLIDPWPAHVDAIRSELAKFAGMVERAKIPPE
jgi:2-dehydropantoate 2-reductase